MESFKDAVLKLEQLRDGGFIAADEFENRKKELVDSYVTNPPGGASTAVAAYSGAQNIVKLRGLPFTATESDVINFFFGFQLDTTEPVKFQINAEGKHSGICFVRFSTEQEATRALTKNKQYLGQRYIEVFPSNGEEMSQRTAPVGATSWVRMRGLPFSATKGDIKAFFEGFNVSDAGIYLVAGKGGRPSGEAFVQFGDEYEAQRALLKDKEAIGMRYIELFLATREECDSAIARFRGDMAFGKGGGFDDFGGFGYGGPPAYAGGFAPSYAAPQSGYAGRFGGKGFGGKGGFAPAGFAGGFAGGFGGAGGDFVVRLRGLPFRATEADIVAFFAGLNVAQSVIVFSGGRPSGEAYVELRDKLSFDGALQRNRQLMGSRYIEVFPASRVEMDTAAFDPYGGGFPGAW